MASNRSFLQENIDALALAGLGGVASYFAHSWTPLVVTVGIICAATVFFTVRAALKR